MKTFADFGIHINRVKGGNQKTTCPNCSPTRKNKLDPCLSVNLDDGTFYCHHCEWKGSTRNNNGDKKKIKSLKPTIIKTSRAVSYINQYALTQSLSVNADQMVTADGRGI